MKLDVLTPSQLPYPGAQLQGGNCQQLVIGGNGSFQSPTRDGLFNSVFTPDDLPYPLPIVQRGGYGTCSCNTGNASGGDSGNAGNAGTTGSSSKSDSTGNGDAKSTSPEGGPTSSPPQQIIINVTAPPAPPACTPPAATTTAGSPTAGDSTTPPASRPATPTAMAPLTSPVSPTVAATGPITGMPIRGSTPPSDTFVQAYAYNPRLRSRTPKAHEELIEEWIQEQISMRMLTAQGAPAAFVVPEGFNAVDFYLGAIELNPGVGDHDDIDQIVTLGEVKLSPNAQPGAGALKTGDQITVTVPWRYASWTELAAEHLRVPVFARFYTIENF